MIDILKKQLEYLKSIEVYTTKDKPIQSKQVDISAAILVDTDKIVSELSNVAGAISNINTITVEEARIERDNRETAEESNVDTIAELKRIRDAIIDSNSTATAQRIDNERVTLTIAQRINNFQNSISNIKNAFSNKETGKITGKSILGEVGNQIGNFVSQRHVDRNEFIKTEQGLGNAQSEKKLKQNFNVKNDTLKKHKANEEYLEKNRGSASREEFLASGSEKANQYLETKGHLEKVLSKVDTRYKNANTKLQEAINPVTEPTAVPAATINPATEPATTRANVDPRLTGLQTLAHQFRNYADNQHNTVNTLSRSNMVENPEVEETRIEDERERRSVEKEQAQTNDEQTKILAESLEVQNKILTKLDHLPSNGSGVGGGLLDIDLPDFGGKEKRRTRPRARSADQRAGIAERAEARGTNATRAISTSEEIATRATSSNRPRASYQRGRIPASNIGVGARTAADIIPEARTVTSTGEGLISRTRNAVTSSGRSVATSLGETALGQSTLGNVARSVSPVAKKAAGAARNVVKWLTKVPGLGTMLTAYNIYDKISELDEQVANGTLPPEEYKKEVTKAIGAALGTTGGAIAGAALGTGAGPIGTIIGGIAGGLGGEIVGEKVASALFDMVGNDEQPVLISDESKSEGINVAGAPVIKGQPLTPEQVKVTDISKSMGNKPRPEVQEAYDLAKNPKIESTSIRPSVETPTAANIVYGKSEENAGINTSNAGNTIVNNISSPTNNVSNQTSNTLMKGGIHNQENSVNKLFASRLQYF